MSRVEQARLHPRFERLECALRERPEVLEAYLFGSQARGDAHTGSDVDVAVFIDRDRAGAAPFGYPAELATVLAAALGADADQEKRVRKSMEERADAARVDVVVLNEAPPLLYRRVLRDGIRLLARDLRATTVRESQAISRYCDYVPHLRKIEAAHSARIARGDFGR